MIAMLIICQGMKFKGMTMSEDTSRRCLKAAGMDCPVQQPNLCRGTCISSICGFITITLEKLKRAYDPGIDLPKDQDDVGCSAHPRQQWQECLHHQSLVSQACGQRGEELEELKHCSMRTKWICCDDL